MVVATRSLLAYQAIPEADPVLPHCDSYQLERGSVSMRTEPLEAIQDTRCDAIGAAADTPRVLFIAGYHRKRAIRRRSFRRCWWPTLAKHSVVLGLVQDEPALRAGAASGILDKTCARRSARGRSAPRNGPFDPTKECDLDLGSGHAASEVDDASS